MNPPSGESCLNVEEILKLAVGIFFEKDLLAISSKLYFLEMM